MNSSLRQVLGSASSTDIISGRRDQLMPQSTLRRGRRAKASRLGIEVIDLRIKRADLPPANQAGLPAHADRSASRSPPRSAPRANSRSARSSPSADKEVAITLATAHADAAETTRGEGDAQRARIFAQSFGKDPSFAAFYRSMQAYEAALGQGDTTLVLSPDSAFFKYFEGRPRRRPIGPHLRRSSGVTGQYC